jgi:hypothetical protein
MAASTTTATHNSFPNVAQLGSPLGKRAADQLSAACEQLRSAGADAAADRISGIDQYVGTADYPILEKLADPELAADELAGLRQRPVRRAHAWRNAVALLPLLVTWIALGFASIYYRAELRAHPGYGTRPFLLLWQEGFGAGFPTFAEVAFFDFAILAIVLVLTWWVHQTESRAAKSRTDVIDGLYTAMDALEAAVNRSTPRAPASADEWAQAAKGIITDAMEQTKLLATTSQQAIEQASVALAGIQNAGRDFIDKFSTDIRETLAAVRRDNEQFINRTATEARETLQRLVEQQMDPLLKQLSAMLAEFGKHQETYRAGVADLVQGVTSIKGSAQDLADSAQAYNRTADSITKSLDAIKTSQENFTLQVTSSVTSMETAATAMTGVKDVLQKDLRDGVRQMAVNVKDASRDLAAVERNLTETSSALSDSAVALAQVTRDLRAAANWLRSVVSARTSSFWQRIRRLFRP